jgi:hypothetical protein
MKAKKKNCFWLATQAFYALLLMLLFAGIGVLAKAPPIPIITALLLAAACGLTMWTEWKNSF